LAPEHTAGSRLHQSTGFIGIFFAADTNCKLRSDIGLSAKRGTVIRENPTHCATYNPAGGGFYRLVENQPDPDGRAG